MVPSSHEIVNLLARYRFRYRDEAQLQEAIERVFLDNHVDFEREVSLTGQERIDFMVAGIGIEVKIHQPPSMVLRQLQRYAQCDQVHHLLLVTAVSKHAHLPRSINYKVLDVVFLGWSFL